MKLCRKPRRYGQVLIVLGAPLVAPAARGNVIGVDAQNFNAITSGLDFVTVHSSETLDPCVLNLGLFGNHAKNTLPIFQDGSGVNRHTDQVTGADLNLGWGIMKNWDLGISLPQILAQSVKSEREHGEFDAKGNTEVRVNTKVRLLGNRQGGLALVGTASVNRMQNNPFAGQDPGPSAAIELVADTTIKRFAVGANIGYRWRNPGEPIPEFPIKPFKDQLIYSAATSYHFPAISTKVILEMFGSRPRQEASGTLMQSQSSLEGLLGLKHDVTQNMSVHLGGGRRLSEGVASPEMRVYAGVNLTFGPFCGRKSKVPQRVAKKVEGKTVPPPPPPKEETIVLQDVHFAFDSFREVLPGTKTELKKLVDYLLTPPVFTSLIIEGHTDSMGSDEYNQVLSENRASQIKRYLVEVMKLDASKISAVGYGKSQPIADNGNYQGRQENRRVEFKIFRE